MASNGNLRARKRVNAAMRLVRIERARQKAERNLPVTPELLYAGPAERVQRSMETLQINHRRLERDLARL